ncbi:isopenicillin N synthase family dioxygenase [Aspergillus lucknowensis]|uniref:Oxidoreductase n=1 Tax=Aspergillus lucknowensis TaxID=176173 RepID=A0ABR4LCG7_9EURO
MVHSGSTIDFGGLAAPLQMVIYTLSLTYLAFYGNNPTQRRILSQKVRQACEKYGFFQIVNHLVPSALQEAILEQSRAFFCLPREVKEQYDKDGGYRGYERLQARGDLQEAYYLGKDMRIDHPTVLAGKFSHGPNKYPTEVKDPILFRRVVDDYHVHLSRLAEDILEVLAETLNLSSDWFEAHGFCHDPIANLRLLHYPAACENTGAQEKANGFRAHTDFGAITILLQDGTSGLQVWDKDCSQWMQMDPVPGAFVVNLGDMMMWLTGNRYISNLHRVVNNSCRDRYSVPFFYSGNPDFALARLPGWENREEVADAPIGTVNDWMTGKYKDACLRD